MDRQVAVAAAAVAVAAAYALAVSLPADVPAGVPAVYTEQADTGQNERTTVIPVSEYGPGGTEPARATAEISVYIDRREYGPGEPIMYSVTNHGPGTASFTGASLGLQVRDLFENTVFGTGGGSLVTEIPPGTTVSDTWDQQAAGRGVQPGTYVLDFGGTRSWPFTITHENPAFYEPGITEGGSPELLVEKRQYLPGEVIRSALVNTGTVAVGSERKIEASVVDASGSVVASVRYDQRDGIIEPGERIQMQSLGNPLAILARGEYRIAVPGGPESEPFVVEGPDPRRHEIGGWIDIWQDARTTHVPIWEDGRGPDGAPERVRIGTAEVSVELGKREYFRGEEISYSVKNHGPGTITFGNAAPNPEVRDLFENTVFVVAGDDLPAELRAGSEVSGAWDQQVVERRAQSGTYVLDFGGIKSWPFTIEHLIPDFYEPETVEGRSVEVLVERRVHLLGEAVRSALVNTGTEAVETGPRIVASVVDASGAVVDSVTYHQRDGIIEPGERIQMQPMGSPLVPPALGEYRIVTSDGLESEPFVVDGPDPSKGPDATVRSYQGWINVSVYIDKLEYEVAEPIMVSITNHGPRVIKFSNTGLDFSIRDLSHRYIHLGSGFYSITPLEVGETAERVLDHIHYGDVLYPGTYVIGFKGIESWPFTITHDNPAFYEPPTVEGYSVELLVEKQRYRPDEIVRWALVNTGTEAATVSRHDDRVTAAVVDASGDDVTRITYGPRDSVLEPGERLYGVWDGAAYESWSRGKPIPPGEYHIVTLNGTRSAPFVIGQDS